MNKLVAIFVLIGLTAFGQVDGIKYYTLERSSAGNIGETQGNYYGYLDTNASDYKFVLTNYDGSLTNYVDTNGVPSPAFFYRLTGYTTNGVLIPFNVVEVYRGCSPDTTPRPDQLILGSVSNACPEVRIFSPSGGYIYTSEPYTFAFAQYCQTLTNLIVTSTPIKVLDVTGSTNLQLINVSSDNLDLLNLSGNTGLLSLTCSENPNLYSVTLPPSLKTFVCSGSSLTNIDPTVCGTNLILFQIQECPLAAPPDTSSNANLTAYMIYTLGFTTNITFLDISANSNLISCDFGNNQLTAGALDAILTNLDNFGKSNGSLEIEGNYGFPTSVGLNSVTNLRAKGWLVIDGL